MRRSHAFQLLVFGAIGVLALTACGGSEPRGVAPASATELAADSSAGYISSSAAGEHMGEDGTVRGTVQDYVYKHTAKGKPYILLFDSPSAVHAGAIDLIIPKSFKVVIWKDYQKNFPENFAASYSGHTVCATGTIVDYLGDPAIEAHDPSQLKIDC